jgi:tripartite-type tricarboxylate transporter receptor subunit TctC
MIIWLRVLLVLATLASSNAFAQQYPTRSVTIVAATTPGSLPDVLARGIGQRLSQKWGQPVVVENRAGGAYAIAASAVANAPADGYTLLASESGLTRYSRISRKGARLMRRMISCRPAGWRVSQWRLLPTRRSKRIRSAI